MSPRQGLRAALLAGFLAVLVSGCGASRSVGSYEPGVYKGAKDPLLDLQTTPDQQERLKKRFTEGQAQR